MKFINEEAHTEALARVEATYPGLQVWFDFVRHSEGLVIVVYDREHDPREPIYVCTLGRELYGRIVMMNPEQAMTVPAFTTTQYERNLDTEEIPPGYISADGKRGP